MAPVFAKLNVLIVDDDPFSLQAMHDLLAKIGVNSVETASAGAQALEILQQGNTIQLLISDLHMPDMDGIKLFAALQTANYAGAIILISATKEAMLDSARQLAEMNGLNILGALKKPARREDMLALLQKYDVTA